MKQKNLYDRLSSNSMLCHCAGISAGQDQHDSPISLFVTGHHKTLYPNRLRTRSKKPTPVPRERVRASVESWMGGNFLDDRHETWGERLRFCGRKPVRIECAQKTDGVPVNEEETARGREDNRAGGATIPHPIVLT